MGLEEPHATPGAPLAPRAVSGPPSVLVRFRGKLHRGDSTPAGFLIKDPREPHGRRPALSSRAFCAVFTLHPRDDSFLYLRAQPLQYTVLKLHPRTQPLQPKLHPRTRSLHYSVLLNLHHRAESLQDSPPPVSQSRKNQAPTGSPSVC